MISCFKIALLFPCVIVLMTVLVPNAVASKPKELDPVTAEWKNISEYWCFPDNLPEAIIDDVYECFRLYKGNKVLNLEAN